MKEQTFSVGDLAQLSGLTIRTLQYYDKINLLPASGKTENGRRFYTKQDIIQRMIFNEEFHNTDQMVEFYHIYKALLIKAVAFDAVGILPHEPAAQELAKQWIDMAKDATSQNEQYLYAYLQVNQNINNWPEGIRLLMEAADSFITDSCKIYCSAKEDGILTRLYTSNESVKE